MEKSEFVQDGYLFFSQKDAQLASLESRKVEYLESKMDYDKPESVLRIYEKAIAEKVFKTPVGLGYLKHLQSYLLECPDLAETNISAIPISETRENTLREQTRPARKRIKTEEDNEHKIAWLPLSIIVNIALLVALAAMFSIAVNSKQPNIINYEKAILNKYADWEQELTEREQAVRDRERELSMEITSY